MVDVGRNDGAAAGDLATHEFGRDLVGNRRAKRLAGVLARHPFGELLTQGASGPERFDVGPAITVFAQGDEFHFRRDDALTRVVNLRDVLAGFRSPWLTLQAGKAQGVERAVGRALATEFGTQIGKLLGVAALGDPAGAHGG